MNTQRLFPVVVILAALLASGCGKTGSVATVQEEHHDDHGEEGVTFKEGKGLHIPPATAKFIGLKVEEVGEKKVSTTTSFDAAVYRAAINAQFAAVTGVASKTSWATATIDQPKATHLGKGQPVAVDSKAVGALSGRISEINSLGGTNDGPREVLIAIKDEERRLQHGETVSITTSASEERASVVVPKSALLRTAEGSFVYTVNGEHFIRAPIKAGVAAGDMVEVLDGLYAGDQIVTNPAMTLWMAELQSIRGGKACADGH